MLELFPAIDIKDGQCVRLYQGDMDRSTVFSDNPGAQAKAFEEAGARWLHVVDLNGAFAGNPVNADAVQSIVESINIPVQLGGGIRNLETISYWLMMGVKRVILGTAALKDPDMVKEACREFPGQIVVGIDAKDGKVATDGWANVTEVNAVDLAHQFEGMGVMAIIYTDIARDGAMMGPNLKTTGELAEAIRVPVIASGGISSLDDVRSLKTLANKGVAGMITGRALYDGAFTIKEALQVLGERV